MVGAQSGCRQSVDAGYRDRGRTGFVEHRERDVSLGSARYRASGGDMAGRLPEGSRAANHSAGRGGTQKRFKRLSGDL